MEAKKVGLWVWGLAVVVVLITVNPVNGITCIETLRKLLFCEGFLQGWGDVSYFCCQGAATLNEVAFYRPDRQIICKCLKLASPLFGVLPDRAMQIPRLCQINLTVSVHSDIDCDR